LLAGQFSQSGADVCGQLGESFSQSPALNEDGALIQTSVRLGFMVSPRMALLRS
jgi:hypothetical protein